MSMSIDKSTATRLARNLKAHLATAHAIDLKHTQCLDAVAAQFGHRNRHEMHAAYPARTPAAPTPDSVLDALRQARVALSAAGDHRAQPLADAIADYLAERGAGANSSVTADTANSAAVPDDAVVFRTDAGWWWREDDVPEEEFDRWVGTFASREEAAVDARKHGHLGGDAGIQEWDVDVSALVRGFATASVRGRSVDLSGWIQAFATIQVDADDEEQAERIAEARWKAGRIPTMVWNARPDVRVDGTTVDGVRGEPAPDILAEAITDFVADNGRSRLHHGQWNARTDRGLKDFTVDAVNPG